MNCDPQTVAACVFQGHSAVHERHECPLVQMLVRRLHNLGIENTPAYVDRELDKYRPVARVLGCPLVAKLSLFDLSPQSSPRWPVWRAGDAVRHLSVRDPHRAITNTAMAVAISPSMRGS